MVEINTEGKSNRMISDNKPNSSKEKKWQPVDRNHLSKWLKKKVENLRSTHEEHFVAINKYFPSYEKFDDEVAHMKDLDLKTLLTEVNLHPSVAQLLIAINTDPIICMWFYNMYKQQAEIKPPEGGIYVQTWQEAILLINQCVNEAPEYDSNLLCPVPMNGILNLPMETAAGNALFSNDKVNVLFKNVLNEWGQYLLSKDSCYVLTDSSTNPGGWFSPEALAAMPDFENTYICDPSLPHYGYTSFDDFFTRRLKDGAREVEGANDQSIIVNACEAAPFRIAYDVKECDSFWIKEQRYSMKFILNKNPLAAPFYGGTVYQGFLSAFNYHRFHSPVDGYIYELELVEGTYFSQPHFKDQDILMNIMIAQPYICHVATRGIFYIKADNPDIGLMVCIAVGMADVSTVEATVKVGDRVRKGQELGMFHFGGSSHVLIFRKGVNVVFDAALIPDLHAASIKINARIAQVL